MIFCLLDVFMRIKLLSFLFLFTYIRFVLFVRVKSSCKKKKKRGLKLPRYPHLLYYWRLPPSTCRKLFVLTYFYLWLSVRIFPFYENLFCLWKSLLIYDHLWGSFLFIRISSYLWLSVRIFPFYENLFQFLVIYDHLWESLFIYHELFYYLFFITLNHLCVLILVFFCHSCIHLDQQELKIFMNINN